MLTCRFRASLSLLCQKIIQKPDRIIPKIIEISCRLVGIPLHRIAQAVWPDYRTEFIPRPSQPWDYVQTCVEKELTRFIPGLFQQSSKAVIAIVGASHGDEVARMMIAYKNHSLLFDLFEPSHATISALQKKYGQYSNIRIFMKAVGDKIGKVNFFETTGSGNGSILPLVKDPGKVYPAALSIKNTERFEVEMTTLDEIYKERIPDLLWIDVQGYEMAVLRGGNTTLNGVKGILIEVQHGVSIYEGGCEFSELDSFLKERGFRLLLLGIDPASNQGNAFYVRGGTVHQPSL